MRTVLALGVAAGLAALVTGCDNRPEQPRLTSPSSAGPFATEIEVAGPRDVAPGTTAQFTATLLFSDGSRRDVTSQAIWNSTETAVLTVSSSGLATGHGVGETTVRAAAEGRSGARTVIVVPAGTFRVSGRVTEADPPNERVGGAFVEVVGGGPALSTGTGGDGTYRLYGVPASGQLRVVKEGYVPHVQSFNLSDHAVFHVQLMLAQPRPDVSGRYALRITAARECEGVLPEEARTRTYTAVLTQSGSRLSATLEGASFFTGPGSPSNRFSGALELDRVSFFLHGPSDYYFYYYYADVIEQIAPSLFFVPVGNVITRLSSSGLAGALDGTLEVREPVDARRFKVAASCRSSAHHFTLSR